jgi:cell division protein FtsI (penicillin-binding protein 3)
VSGGLYSDEPVLSVADVEFAAVNEGRIRIRISLVIFLFMIAIVIARLAEVALLSPEDHRRAVPIADMTTRADLTDRHGVLLATTLSTYSLYAEPSRIWNAEEAAEALVRVRPHLDRLKLIEQLSSERAFVWIDRGLSPKEHQAVFDLGLPGLGFRTEPKRIYPGGDLASHLIGWTDIDLQGAAGAERALNERLSGPGAPDVALSVDARVQFAVSEELAKAVEKFSAKSGAGVVLDVQSGEIIAMASVPDFNANIVGESSPESRFNTASMATYDLGSVFKPLTVAMALQDGLTTREEMFDVHKPYKIHGKYIRDDHPSDVPLDLDGVLAESSNRGTAMLADRIGAERQQYYLRELGLLSRVPYELSESARPQVQARWGDMATVTVSYGHGLAVTPLALTNAIGAAVNDGVYVRPTVLKRDAARPAETRRVFSTDVSQNLVEMMRLTVTDGTGRRADVPGFGVMGKTGTAEKPSATGGYDRDRLVTSFVAAWPYTNPRYAMIITLDEPQAIEGTFGYATAGWNAAPTAGRVIERVGPMLPGSRAKQQTASLELTP